MVEYSFKNRLNKLLSLDNIRILKFLEIIQYCFLHMFFVIIVTHIIDKHYYNKITINKNQEKSVLNFLTIVLIVFIETVILTIILFYIRKIVLLFPSLGNIYNKNFIPHTTLEYTLNISLIYIFFELLPKFRERFDILIKYFN